MATVNGYTAEHTDEVFAEDIVDGFVNGSGQLVLVQRDGTQLIRQNVVGPTGPSAANPVPWAKATAYTTGAIVGYAGALWKCTANNTGHPPHLFSNEWTPIEGFDYTTQWSSKDPYFIANDPLVAWETFWKTGTSTVSITTTAGEFETGDQALKVALAASSSQTLYQKEENVVRGGEVITVLVRAKLRVAAAGSTIGVGMFQNDIAGDPAPFGTGSSNVGSAEGTIALTTAFKTYQFTLTAVAGKSRAVPYLSLVSAAAAADILIDRVEVTRNKALNLQALNVPVGTIVEWPSNTIPPGWLALSGPNASATASRTAYPELFALMGTAFGNGDGSTTFGLPNFVGRAPMGVYPGGPYAATIGATGGESSHVLSIAEMPVHDHGQVVLANGVTGSGQRVDYAGDRAFAGRFPQGTVTDANGGGAAHNVLDPYTAVIFIIRATPSAGVDQTTFQYFKGAVAANAAVAMAANTNMPFTVRTDPTQCWNATNNNWVCPQPGRYRITISWRANSTAASRAMTIAKNGTVVAKSPSHASTPNAGDTFVEVLDLLPGDTIAARPDTAFTTNADGAGIENTYMIVESVGLVGVATGLSDSGNITPVYQNGWRDYSPLSGGDWEGGGYQKINGLVVCKGLLAAGTATSGTVVFNLNPGFRPLKDRHFLCLGATGDICTWNVMRNGDVKFRSGTNGYASLDGITFVAAN